MAQPIAPGTGHKRARLATGPAGIAVLATLVAAALPAAATAEEPQHRFEVEIEIGGGYDDNPLRVTSVDSRRPRGVDIPDAGFAHAHIVSSYEIEHQSLRWRPRFHGDSDQYGSSLSRGDEWRTNLDLPLWWTPYRSDGRRLRFAFEPFYEEKRETFNRRRSGEEFQDVAGNRLEDRFDSRSYGANFEVRYGWGAWKHIDLEVRLRERDYLEDFDEPGQELIDSLDYDAVNLLSSFTYRITDHLSINVGGKYRKKEYDEKVPFFSDGSEARVLPTFEAVEPQEYRYTGYSTWMRFKAGRHRLKIHYRRTQRDDEFEGYLDYTKAEWDIDWDFAVSQRFALSIDLEYERLRYPNAHVSFDPARPLKLSTELYGRVEGSIQLVPDWNLIVYAAREDEESRNESFTYDRNRFGVSIQYVFQRS